MRIYVASAFQDYARTRAMHKVLRDAGHTITHNWTREVEQFPRGDVDAPDGKKAILARQDLQGVTTCDLFVLLTSRENGCGCYVELGIAIATNKRIIVTGPDRDRTIFTQLAERRFETDAEAVTYINRA